MSVKKIKIGIIDTGNIYKVTNIYLLSDGSFKVDIPYCKCAKGIISRASIGYGSGIHKGDFVQQFSINNRPQLSIHSSGFVQFSGKGIISGIDAQGKIKGMGLHSNPLKTPISSGPTFGIQLWGLEDGFEISHEEEKYDVLFEKSDFVPRNVQSGKELNTYIIEGWVLPYNEKLASQCMWKKDGKEKITLSFPQYIHSPNAVFTLDVIWLKTLKVFIGLSPFITDTGFPDNSPFGFVLGGPSEQSKDNPTKRIIMNAMSANIYKKDLPSLDFK